MDVDSLLNESNLPLSGRAAWASLVEDALSVDSRAAVTAPRSWRIVQRCDDTDLARANEQARADIANGATGLALVFEGAPNAFGYGLPDEPDALDRVLDGIALDQVHLRIDAHPSSRAMADRLVDFLVGRRAEPSRLSVSFGIDAAAVFAGTGRLRMSIEALQASMPQSLAHFFAMGVPGVLLEADGRVFHNAGASPAQELGAMIAGGVSHLRLFEEARQALIYAAPHIGFATSVDQNPLASMAKLRALSLLWQRAEAAASLPPARATIHAETSYRMMTALDPEANIGRAALAAIAAAAGGADTVSVLPHTAPHGLPAASARATARESQLRVAPDRFADLPGLEALNGLTDALCEAAWAEFETIESEGGLLRSLAAGQIQHRVLSARAETTAKARSSPSPDSRLRPATTAPVETLTTSRRPLPTDGAVFCERLEPLRLDEHPDGQASG